VDIGANDYSHTPSQRTMSTAIPPDAPRLAAPVRLRACRPGLALGLAVVAACGAPAGEPAPAPGPRVLRVEGSTTLYPAMRQVAERFEAQHPGIDVLTGKTSSSEGMSMLIHGSVDVAASSRPPTAQELERARKQGVVLKPYQVGYDAVVVIVHPRRFASVPALSQAQVRDIFLGGGLRHWSRITREAVPAGAPQASAPGDVAINVYARAPAQSGTALVFVENLAGDWQTPFIDGARLLTGEDDMVAAVAADPDGIGFAPLGEVDERVRAVALSSDGRRFIAPSAQTIRDLSYPLRRNLYLVTRGTPRGDLNLLLRFVLGPAGQAALASAGVLAMH
jgi:phosphate transport system substrate-binding protein